jgi:hypothetical protein
MTQMSQSGADMFMEACGPFLDGRRLIVERNGRKTLNKFEARRGGLQQLLTLASKGMIRTWFMTKKQNDGVGYLCSENQVYLTKQFIDLVIRFGVNEAAKIRG